MQHARDTDVVLKILRPKQRGFDVGKWINVSKIVSTVLCLGFTFHRREVDIFAYWNVWHGSPLVQQVTFYCHSRSLSFGFRVTWRQRTSRGCASAMPSSPKRPLTIGSPS